MKILNLYCGIGGNRKLWGDTHEVTAVELDPKVAEVYKAHYPKDNVIVGDAHKYLIDHFKEFDFIWASPPCPTHSKLRYHNKVIKYPDMDLYSEILLLQHWFDGLWVIENVIAYYEPLIAPNVIMHRHAIWTNFSVSNKEFKNLQTGKARGERELLEKEFGFDLSGFDGIDKRKALRNCVVPEMGAHILNCAMGIYSSETRQQNLFEV